MATELLVSWLNEAYSMEQAQLQMLEQSIKDFERYPDIKSELRQHLLETKRQAEDIRDCLASLDGTLTDNPGVAHNFLAMMEGAGSHLHDEPVKHLIVLYAGKQYEQAAYQAIAEAARGLAQDDIADTCERIAEEEHAMAEWAEEQIPAVVTSCVTTAREEV